MSTESIILLENVSAEAIDSATVYSGKQKGAGYHKRYGSLHTATYEVDSFIGSIKLQGTLELYPGESDWVDISGTDVGLSSDSSAWSALQTFNFTGNFVWIRAAYNLQNGTIIQIRYNY